MSFNENFKKEILSTDFESNSEKFAFLAGVFRQIGSIHICKQNVNLVIECDFYDLILKVAERIKILYNVEIEIKISQDKSLNKTIYTLNLPANITKDIAQSTKIIKYNGDIAISFTNSINEYQTQEEIKAYMLGVAVSSANISVPVKQNENSDIYDGSYSLEIRFNSENIADEVMEYFAGYDILFKKFERMENFMLQIRESEMISDFMAYCGCSDAVLEINNIMVARSVRNKTNRERNCVIANIDKAVVAGQKQYQAIKLIDSKIGLENLSEKLRVIAKIRLDNPDFSLDQIAEEVCGGISKSGINHRFRKIMEIANAIQK